MSKDFVQIKRIKGKSLTFSEFWCTIASELGNSRLKVDRKAQSIRYFLALESDHRAFLRTLIHQSYKRCHCYHLNAPIDVNIVLDLLGETNHTLQGSKEDDLLDIELLEEIAWLVSRHYHQLIEMPTSMLPDQTCFSDKSPSQASSRSSTNTNQIVSISGMKIRKANQKL